MGGALPIIGVGGISSGADAYAKITAGASAPEVLVREVVEGLAKLRPISEETITTTEEKMVFKLPRELREDG